MTALRLRETDASVLPRSRWPRHEEDEIAAVAAVLRSGRVNSLVHGDQCRAFEAEFADFCGMPFAISLANGTTALELALRALGIGSGDEVIVPARSFFATAACVVAVGATPVFADIDPVSQTIDPASVEALAGDRTRAVIAVHLSGWPCEMDSLQRVCAAHDLELVEDCAQAHGAEYRGRRVGSFGAAAAFSFCTDKIISTGGEGGMLLLAERSAWARAWAYKDHGKNPAKVFNPVPGKGFRYVHDSFGSNFRMTEMQAAIGRAQLAKLPEWLARRRANAAALADGLADDPLIRLPAIPDYVGHAFYRFAFLIEPTRLASGCEPSDLLAWLNAAGVPAASGSCPDMSREFAFHRAAPRRDGALSAAAEIGRRSVVLPVDHTFEPGDMRRIAATICAILDEHGDRLWVRQ
ncbi:MAG TPA: DegT/DnrJ/EryC1/StrS family aminotransferase [Sphingomonas sp.]|nr:DegT/DnrJ/EryC1/StrS family aminotransferase [Sphingomonas sp.]